MVNIAIIVGDSIEVIADRPEALGSVIVVSESPIEGGVPVTNVEGYDGYTAAKVAVGTADFDIHDFLSEQLNNVTVDDVDDGEEDADGDDDVSAD